MKLTPVQVERTLHQFDAEAIPAEHPIMSQLERLFGSHTYFLANNGLNIVEPLDGDQDTGRFGVVINLASWADETAANLQPHEPEPTEVVVEIESDSLH